MDTSKIIQLPKITDPRGNLTFIESNQHIPFDIKRAYWIYDVPGGETRGGHAFKEQEEFIIALSGSFDVIVDNGKSKKDIHLNRSYFGVHVPAGNWRTMENFSTNSLALVLASTFFNKNDYILDYIEFQSLDLSQRKKHTKNQKNEKNEYLVDFIDAQISTVEDCTIVDLDKNHCEKGNITVVENRQIVPFDIQRVYYLYDVPGGEERGGHAHRNLYQLIVAASGSFDVVINDGKNKKKITLNRPYKGLYIIPGIWREIVNFSSGSSCLVLVSEKYDEGDYIRDCDEFTKYKLNG